MALDQVGDEIDRGADQDIGAYVVLDHPTWGIRQRSGGKNSWTQMSSIRWSRRMSAR